MRRYELAARRARFESGTAHIEAGKKLQKAGDLEKALAEFQKAFDARSGIDDRAPGHAASQGAADRSRRLSAW